MENPHANELLAKGNIPDYQGRYIPVVDDTTPGAGQPNRVCLVAPLTLRDHLHPTTRSARWGPRTCGAWNGLVRVRADGGSRALTLGSEMAGI